MSLAASGRFYLPLLLIAMLSGGMSGLKISLPGRCGGNFTAWHATATFGAAASQDSSPRDVGILAPLFCGGPPRLCEATALSTGCGAWMLPRTQASGRVVVVVRGGCTYTAKAVAAQEVGAVGLVVVESERGRRVSRMLGREEKVRIPVVMVGWGDWERVAGCVEEARVGFDGKGEARGVGSVVVRAVVVWLVCRGLVGVLRWGGRNGGDECRRGWLGGLDN